MSATVRNIRVSGVKHVGFERKQISVPRGAVCYCCVRASLLLRVTRSVEAFKKVPGAMDIWRLRSKQEQAKLAAYDGDKCMCEACTS